MVVFTNVAGDDFFTVHRIHLYPGFLGQDEQFLEIRTGDNEFRKQAGIPFSRLDTISLRINENEEPAVADLPAAYVFNFGDEARADDRTFLDLGVLPELWRFNPASETGSTTALIAPGFQTGVANEVNIDLSAVSVQLNTGDIWIVQALVFDPRSQYSPGLMATNEAWFSGVGIDQIVVEAVANWPGQTFFNADQSAGYFKITWKSGPPITGVRFDLDNSSNINLQEEMVFDTDQTNMADILMAGNSTHVGCLGTYRNDSDVLTGLVYDGTMNTEQGVDGNAPCQAIDEETNQFVVFDDILTGFTGTWGDQGGGDSFQILDFFFNDFGLDGGAPAGASETFEFDASAEGFGNGSAQSLVGMRIEITLDGMQDPLVAELLPDSSNPERAFVGW